MKTRPIPNRTIQINNHKMSIQVSRMTEADIDGAIDTIQQAFADDPYNNWIYPDRSKVFLSHPCYKPHH